MKTVHVIERFIMDELAPQGGPRTIGPDESLFAIGALDSLDFVRLIVFIQEQFGVTVEDGEVIPDNFHTLNGIQAFLEKKQQGH